MPHTPHTDTSVQAENQEMDFELRPGNPLPFGASLGPGGINFSIASHHATSCTLVLFERGQMKPMAEIRIPATFRTGAVYSIIIMGLDPEQIEYGFRLDGPRHPMQGNYVSVLQISPYLKELGVNCIELMPIFEFEEFENWRISPETGETLLNYWGYAPLGFFAPKVGDAASGGVGGEINEFKTLVREL